MENGGNWLSVVCLGVFFPNNGNMDKDPNIVPQNLSITKWHMIAVT
jgi:hypothetical protein